MATKIILNLYHNTKIQLLLDLTEVGFLEKNPTVLVGLFSKLVFIRNPLQIRFVTELI